MATAEHFNNICSKVRREPLHRWYLLNKYDNYFLYHAVSNSENVMGRVINALIKGLNAHIQLPRFLIIMLDSDVISLTTGYNNTEFLIQSIIGPLVKQIQKRKLAIRQSQPKYLLIKPLPFANWVNAYRTNKNDRRVFGHCL